MKRQYRYKTAADTKDFFPRHWFDEFNNLVGELHDEMLKTFNNQSVFMKIKDRITGKPYDLLDYTDAYVFPNDACDKIMGLLSEYETWYTDEWTFLEKDSYDKLKEAINRCDFIKVNLKKFADNKGKTIVDELKAIRLNVKDLIDCCKGSGSCSHGYDKSNKNIIEKFFKECSSSSDVKKKLDQIHKFLNAFLKDIKDNTHYWNMAKNDSSEIITRSDEVKAEVEQEKRNKKEDAEAERNKKTEKRHEEAADAWDKDTVKRYIVDLTKPRILDFIDEINRGAKFLGPSLDYTKINAAGYPIINDPSKWNDACDRFFILKIKDPIKDRITKRNINTQFDGSTVQTYINRLWSDIENECKDTSNAFVALNNNNTVGPFANSKNEQFLELLKNRLKTFLLHVINAEIDKHSVS